jgi:hypothetical protein
METQKEKSQLPPALFKDRSNSAANELVKSDENRLLNSDGGRLCVARNTQLNSVSPTSHKVQFVASLGSEDDEADNPAARGPLTTAGGNINSLQQHQAQNYAKNFFKSFLICHGIR